LRTAQTKKIQLFNTPLGQIFIYREGAFLKITKMVEIVKETFKV